MLIHIKQILEEREPNIGDLTLSDLIEKTVTKAREAAIGGKKVTLNQAIEMLESDESSYTKSEKDTGIPEAVRERVIAAMVTPGLMLKNYHLILSEVSRIDDELARTGNNPMTSFGTQMAQMSEFHQRIVDLFYLGLLDKAATKNLLMSAPEFLEDGALVSLGS